MSMLFTAESALFFASPKPPLGRDSLFEDIRN